MYLRWMSVTDLANQDQALEADHCGLNGGSLLFASIGGHERGGRQVQSCMRPPLSWNSAFPEDLVAEVDVGRVYALQASMWKLESGLPRPEHSWRQGRCTPAVLEPPQLQIGVDVVSHYCGQ